MVLPGRKYSTGNQYRYGFNGKENDRNISEGGQDFGARIFESRLGRWLACDPKTNPYESPYVGIADDPVNNVDPDGKDFLRIVRIFTHKQGSQKVTVDVVSFVVKQPGKDQIILEVVSNYHDAVGRFLSKKKQALGPQIFTIEMDKPGMVKIATPEDRANNGIEPANDLGANNATKLFDYATRNPEIVDFLYEKHPNVLRAIGYAEVIRRADNYVKAISGIVMALTEGGALGGFDGLIAKIRSIVPMSNFARLSDLEARKWCLAQESKFASWVDQSASLETQAKQAFSLRNLIRTTARELMKDRAKAEGFYKTDPNMTWDEVFKKYNGNYKEIIKASTRSRQSVNKNLGL
ncbi:MAG: RHS repeat-associated core domain-containing protein [Chitinophagaceae bacterium]